MVIIDGILTANGENVGNWAGAGSGGSIFIICGTFDGGTNGMLRANGGSTDQSNGGAGGGGRIAVWYNVPSERYAGIADGSNMRHVIITDSYVRFTGTLSVTNGLGYVNMPPDGATPGSLVFLTVKRLGSLMHLR